MRESRYQRFRLLRAGGCKDAACTSSLHSQATLASYELASVDGVIRHGSRALTALDQCWSGTHYIIHSSPHLIHRALSCAKEVAKVLPCAGALGDGETETKRFSARRQGRRQAIFHFSYLHSHSHLARTQSGRHPISVQDRGALEAFPVRAERKRTIFPRHLRGGASLVAVAMPRNSTDGKGNALKLEPAEGSRAMAPMACPRPRPLPVTSALRGLI